jgi:15,16-dihydrobiliverdin:ferredoxin oxidoreductase
LQSRPIPSALEVNVSERGKTPATIGSWCYDCRQLRKIRYTYIDAGESAQVFNRVIYPTHNYDLPLLGIHLLSLSKKKILVLLDFGPLFRDEAYIAKYVLAAYLDLVDRAKPVTSGAKLDNILQAQLLYLRYRGEKNPARIMFKRCYGQEWTEEYIHGFLFDWEQKLAQLVSNKN